MSKRLNRLQVPVHFNGNIELVKNVTKYTTCDDVKHVLMLKSGISIKRIASYSLFEVNGDLERMLQGRTRILKTLRSWGSEKANLKLVLKTVDDDKTCLLSDNMTEYDDSAGDAHTTAIKEGREFLYSPLLIKPSKSILSSNENLIKYAVKKALKSIETVNSTNAKEQNKPNVKALGQEAETAEDRLIIDNSMGKSQLQKKSRGRKALLQKYLHGLIPIRKTQRSTKRSNKEGLLRNEMTMDNKTHESQLLDDAKKTMNTKFPDLEEMCRYYWHSNSESDNDSDLDDDHDDDYLIDFNKAFLKSDRDSTCDDSIDHSDTCFGDLNTAFIAENNVRINSSKSVVNDTDISISDTSNCELEQNISTCDVVKNMFYGRSPGGTASEDDAMDSFMRTRIYDSESDDEMYLW